MKQFANRHANTFCQKQEYISCKDITYGYAVCPVCHFPVGSGGYLRRDLPVGHPDFGKPMPCPACNAKPPF